MRLEMFVLFQIIKYNSEAIIAQVWDMHSKINGACLFTFAIAEIKTETAT